METRTSRHTSVEPIYEECRFCGFKTATYPIEGLEGTYCSICSQIPARELIGNPSGHEYEDVSILASTCWIANRLLHEVRKLGRNGS